MLYICIFDIVIIKDTLKAFYDFKNKQKSDEVMIFDM